MFLKQGGGVGGVLLVHEATFNGDRLGAPATAIQLISLPVDRAEEARRKRHSTVQEALQISRSIADNLPAGVTFSGAFPPCPQPSALIIFCCHVTSLEPW